MLQGGNSQIILAGQDTVRELTGNDTFTVSQGANASIATADMTNINETDATVSVSFADPTIPGPVRLLSRNGGRCLNRYKSGFRTGGKLARFCSGRHRGVDRRRRYQQ